MPRIVNEHDQPKPTPEYILSTKIASAFRQTWTDEYKLAAADFSQMDFSRISVVAITQTAAIVGVDVGMNVEQFVSVCRANFEEAFKRAPKFS